MLLDCGLLAVELSKKAVLLLSPVPAATWPLYDPIEWMDRGEDEADDEMVGTW